MRRALLIASLLAIVITPQTYAVPANWHKTAAAAEKVAKAKKQMIFVDLFAQWCGWCHKFEADVIPTEAFQKTTDKMVLLRLDTEDGADGSAFAQKYQITSLPTFIVLNYDMTIVGLIRGYAPAPDFVKILDNTLAKYKTFQQMVASESTFAKDYDKRITVVNEFMNRQNFPQAETRLKKILGEQSVPAAYRDQAFYKLGVVYLMEGKYDDVKKTVDDFSKVQKEGESYERARLLRSDICMAQGNLQCALTELKNFKQRFPNSPFIPNVDMMVPAIERQLKQ